MKWFVVNNIQERINPAAGLCSLLAVLHLNALHYKILICPAQVLSLLSFVNCLWQGEDP